MEPKVGNSAVRRGFQLFILLCSRHVAFNQRIALRIWSKGIIDMA